MDVIHSIQALRNQLKECKKFKVDSLLNRAAVGFVPTMGFLHPGHASLLRRARQENDIVVLSIFVNPLQFGPNEDFERYPRNTENDLAIAGQAGVDFVFMPETAEMYPAPMKTVVKVEELTDLLCGASRPGHFDGVATVVSKLLHIVEPDNVYFGIKDAQQVAVIEQMVKDLNMRVNVVPCPTVRESDGLAMSSRNVYLSEAERREALVLSQALQMSEQWLHETQDIRELEQRIAAYIQTAPSARIDYVKALAYPALQEMNFSDLKETGSRLLVALAVKFGNTRLIDNRLMEL